MIHCLDFARENDNKINPLPDTPPITELPFPPDDSECIFQACMHEMPFRAPVRSWLLRPCDTLL